MKKRGNKNKEKKTEEGDLQENRERTKRRMCVGSGIRN